MSWLRSFGYRIGISQASHPWRFVLGAVLLTLLTLPGIPLLLGNVEPSLEKVLPQDIKEVQIMNAMRSQYGADMLYIVLTDDAGNDILSESTLRYVDALSQSLRQIENIREVVSSADIVKEDLGRIPLSSHETIALLKEDPRLHTFINKDRTLTVIQVRSDTGASSLAIKEVITDIQSTLDFLDTSNPGVSARITGFNAIDRATFSIILSDFASITLISFALMVAYLLLHYRFSIKKTIYSLVVMMFSLIWALGVTGYLGIPLNVVTMVSAAMILALGSSYGINSVYHFYDDFLLQYGKKEAIAKFQEFLIVGLTGSAFAEIAGFLALLFGIMPSMQDLGIILAIGIFFALIASVFILPAFFYLMEKDNKVRA